MVKKMKFEIGDRVKVVAYTPGKYPPGMEDEMGTEALFQSLVGKSYRVYWVDQIRYLELRPTRQDTVWINPIDVELQRKHPKR
jgi:hypothetical protein